MNNLNQVGKALEGYCGDFGQYFPCWSGWGSDLPTSGSYTNEAGLYVETVGGTRQVVATAPAYVGYVPRDTGRSFSQTIAAGYKAGAPAGSFTAGQLNMAPVGLGVLATSGYATDLRTMYCASAQEMRGMVDTGTAQYYPCDLRALTRAGNPGDPKTLTQGNWTWVNQSPYHTGWTESVRMGCSYHYRNNPAFVNHLYLPAAGPFKRPLHWTAPKVEVWGNCPMFKTQKILGNRVVVTDTWSRDRNTYGTVGNPGRAAEAHREGYSALYGDGHAGWYGDPQQTIMWYKRSNYANPGNEADVVDNLFTIGYYGYYFAHAGGGLCVPYGSVYVWHMFDVANGQDVGAPMYPGQLAGDTLGPWQ